MIKQFILSALFFYSATMLRAQNRTGTDVLHHPELVSAFYTLIDKQNFWLDNPKSLSLRKNFVNVIDSAANWALDATDYHDKELHRFVEMSFTQNDSVVAKHCELVFTDAAISFFKDFMKAAIIMQVMMSYLLHVQKLISELS
jgi:hypothetical protein